MKISILNIGDELLSGKVVNTNAAEIGEFLTKIGYFVFESVVVRDDEADIVRVLKNLTSHSEIIICTGGLGPTRDDITRFAVSRFLKTDGFYSRSAQKWLREYLSEKSRAEVDIQKVQTWMPRGCRPLRNRKGTACGFIFRKGKCRVFVLPGVPRELRNMLQEYVAPVLAGKSKVIAKTVWLWGISESKLQECVGLDKLPQGLRLSILASAKGICLSCSVHVSELSPKVMSEKEEVLDKFWNRLLSRVPDDAIIHPDGLDVSEAVVDYLVKCKATITIAESCTGGALGFLLTSVPGSSVVFHQGIITYSNSKKIKMLGVNSGLLKKEGAVSKAVVHEMVRGAINSSNADFACATSGIAGPGGGTAAKPVGTVWMGVGSADKIITRKLQLKGTRDQIRWRAAYSTLSLMQMFLKELNTKKHLHK